MVRQHVLAVLTNGVPRWCRLAVVGGAGPSLRPCCASPVPAGSHPILLIAPESTICRTVHTAKTVCRQLQGAASGPDDSVSTITLPLTHRSTDRQTYTHTGRPIQMTQSTLGRRPEGRLTLRACCPALADAYYWCRSGPGYDVMPGTEFTCVPPRPARRFVSIGLG